MSANNWAVCPKCQAHDELCVVLAEAEAKSSYGIASPEEYEARVLGAKKQRDALAQAEKTLREDYELGLHEGKFYVSYRGDCTVCDFVHVFKHEEAIGVKQLGNIDGN